MSFTLNRRDILPTLALLCYLVVLAILATCTRRISASPYDPVTESTGSAAPEMPLQLQLAVEALEHQHKSGVAEGVKSWWRNFEQPVAVGMTPELDLVLSLAETTCDKCEAVGYKDAPKSWRAAIAAVRQQAGKVKRPKLKKVRELIEWEVKNNGSGLWAAAGGEVRTGRSRPPQLTRP